MPLDETDKQFLENLINQKVTTVNDSVTTVSDKVKALEHTVQLLTARLENMEAKFKTECEVSKVFRQWVHQLEEEVDDLQQYGRRYIARIEGIPAKKGESEDELFDAIKKGLQDVDYNLQRGDLANFHRSAKPRDIELASGEKIKTQQCMLKFYKWAPSVRLYGLNKKAKRKNVTVRANNDLTKRRYRLLNAARDQVNAAFGEQNEMFVYSDRSSNLKFHLPDNTAVSFRSESDVAQIIKEIKIDQRVR